MPENDQIHLNWKLLNSLILFRIVAQVQPFAKLLFRPM